MYHDYNSMDFGRLSFINLFMRFAHFEIVERFFKLNIRVSILYLFLSMKTQMQFLSD